jgi:hypothetical protein
VKTNAVGGHTLLTEVDGRTLSVHAGGSAYGYRLEVWLRKAGYLVGTTELTAKLLRQFLADVQQLHETFRIEFCVRGWDLGTVPAVERLQLLTKRVRGWKELKCHFLVPVDLPKESRRQLAALGLSDSQAEAPRRHSLDHIGVVVQLARQNSHFTQAQVAQHLGVSTALVSQWESGKRTIAAKHWPALIELMGSIEFAA